MDKRLIKNNLLFFVVCGIALAISIVLICISLVEYFNAQKFIELAGDYRKQIEEFGKKNPAPVQGNEAPLKKDTELFDRIAKETQGHFGFPYQKAVDRFVELLDLPLPKDTPEKERVAAARAEFMKIYNEVMDGADPKEYATVGLRWNSLKDKKDEKGAPIFANWKKASREFAAEVQKTSLEPFAVDDTGVVDEIIRNAFGMPRYLQGKPENLRTYILNYRYRVNDLLARNNVKVLCAPEFGFPPDGSVANFSIDEYPFVVRQWDVIGDLARRMVAAKVEALNDFVIRFENMEDNRGKFDSSFVESNGYEVAHYTVELTGSMASIRRFAQELNDAYKDNRIYVIRSIFFYAVDDGARTFFAQTIAGAEPAAEATAERTVRGPRGRGRAMSGDSGEGSAQDEQTKARMREAERLRLERENSLAYYERAGYGQTVIGAMDIVRAVFDIDYVVLKK